MGFARSAFRTGFGDISYLEGPKNGEPMVWLHGVSRHAESFGTHLEAFAANWHVFSLDARGHGRSSRTPGRYSWLDHAGDLIAFLDEVTTRPAVLIGHSLGALQAVAAAAERPDRVRAAILEDPPLYAGERTDFDPTVFKAMEAAASSGMTLEQILAAWPPEPWMTDAFRRDQAEALTQVDPENLRVTIDLGATRGFDVDSRLSTIACPTLLIRAGGVGAALRPQDEARALHRLARGSSVTIGDCGHMVHAQRPAEYRKAIENFTASLPALV